MMVDLRCSAMVVHVVVGGCSERCWPVCGGGGGGGVLSGGCDGGVLLAV